MKILFQILILLSTIFISGVASAQSGNLQNDTIPKYHYCRIQEGSRITFDFGENDPFYRKEMNVDLWKKDKRLGMVTVLNKMSEFGWEVSNVYFTVIQIPYSSTPNEYTYWVLKRKVER